MFTETHCPQSKINYYIEATSCFKVKSSVWHHVNMNWCSLSCALHKATLYNLVRITFVEVQHKVSYIRYA